MTANLEVGCEAHSKASRWPYGIAGKKTIEVDDVKNVGEVLSVYLKPDVHTIRLVNIRACRGIDLEGGVDAASGKVNAIQHLLTVLCEHSVWVPIKLEGKATVILDSAGNPEPWLYLIAN